MPVQLHLLVLTPAELQASAAQLADAVARAIHPAPGFARRVGKKRRRRLHGIVEIAPRHPNSTDEKLALESLRRLLKCLIEDISPRALDRPADAHWLVPVIKICRPGRRFHGRLRRAIDVVQRDAELIEEPAAGLFGQRFATAKTNAQAPAFSNLRVIAEGASTLKGGKPSTEIPKVRTFSTMRLGSRLSSGVRKTNAAPLPHVWKN